MLKHNKLSILILASVASLSLTACSSGSSSNSGAADSNITGFPSGYQCLPYGLPSQSSMGSGIQIAYAQNCSVSASPQTQNLQKMAVALELYVDKSKLPPQSELPASGYYNYCTGTPIKYDPSTGVGFIVTAAHCVVGGTKAANTPPAPNNITTFDPTAVSGNIANKAWIYQGTGNGSTAPMAQSNMAAQIVAVYIPSQYCEVPQFDADGNGCSSLSEQNGDIAVLKVNTLLGKTLNKLTNLQLAPSDYKIDSESYLLALGYGGINQPTPNPLNGNLNYINYQYFAANSYQLVSGESVILNGYLLNSAYYSIICQGDSGGGDFAWDAQDSMWNLIGAHSYGSAMCGAASNNYFAAYDASADIRPFSSWIEQILNQDTSPTGCASLSDAYVCNSGSGSGPAQ